MEDNRTWQELVALTGSSERATAILKVLQDGRQVAANKQLTPAQRQLYLYLASGRPLLNQRQLARDAGFDHPQKMLAALGALVVKGYVIAHTIPSNE